MKLRAILVLLTLAICAPLTFGACGGSSSKTRDLTPIYDTLTFFPTSRIDGGPTAPATIVRFNLDDYKNDRRMFVESPSLTTQQVMDYYTDAIPKLGWTKEDPVKPKLKAMKEYCDQAPFITCLGFVKGDVRMIVSAPMQIQLNPQAPRGVSYHFHLEVR